MGKTYIDTVKYTIHAKFSVDGLVEKPDVVGAIFGQTEGLLGEELDLRDLQKNGRIGRIEVNTTSNNVKTSGLIKIPSSLDRIETAVVAAAMETVDRVGPCDAKFEIEKIEDNRDAKRKRIVEKAKDLFKVMLNDQIPDSKEIIELVRADVKTDETQTYGPDKLVAGKGIDKNETVILVEGRADVLNLLRNDIDNVIAIGGAKITPSIIEITKKKEIIVFLDGDRGGDIILNELVNAGAEIDFVARAPSGQEVEELTRKELIKAIRSTMPFNQYQTDRENANARRQEEQRNRFGGSYSSRPRYQDYQRDRQSWQQRSQPAAFQGAPKEQPSPGQASVAPVRSPEQQAAFSGAQQEQPNAAGGQPEAQKQGESPKGTGLPVLREGEPEPERQESRPGAPSAVPAAPIAEPAAPKERIELSSESLMRQLGTITGQSKARIYNTAGELSSEAYVRDMIRAIDDSREPFAIVFDGIITQRLVDIAAQKGTKWLVGTRTGNVRKVPDSLSMITSQ
jgi:DNA primase